MAEQPRRQIFSAPNQQRLAYAPNTQGIRQAGQEAEASGRILNSLGTVGNMRKQYIAEQQREIDTRDKHLAVSRRMRHLPEIKVAIAEANLEGAKPEEVLQFVKGLDSYHNIFAEIDNPETKGQLYQGLDDELWGEATSKQYEKLSADRQNLAVETLASVIELNRGSGPESIKAAMDELKLDFTDPEGYYKYSPEEYDTLMLGHLQARVQAGEYEVADTLSNSYKAITADGVNLQTKLNGDIGAGLLKIEKARIEQAYLEDGDRLILKPDLTAAEVEAHVQYGESKGLFPDGVAQDKYRQYMLKKLGEGSAMIDVWGLMMNGFFQSRDQLRHYISEGMKERGGKPKDSEQLERQVVQQYFAHTQEALADAIDEGDPFKIQKAQESLALSIRMRPLVIQNQLVGLASAVLPPDEDIEDGVMNGPAASILYPQDGSPALWDIAASAYGGNEFAMIQDQIKDQTQRDRLQDIAVYSEAFGNREKGFRVATDHQYRNKLARDPSHNAKDVEDKVNEFLEDFPPEYLAEYKNLVSRYENLPLKTADKTARAILRAKAGELDEGIFEWGRPVYGGNAQQVQTIMHDALENAIGDEDPKTGLRTLRSADSPRNVMDSFITSKLNTHNISYGTDYDDGDVVVHTLGNGSVILKDSLGLPLGGRAYSIGEIIDYGINRRNHETRLEEERQAEEKAIRDKRDELLREHSKKSYQDMVDEFNKNIQQ